MGVWDYFMRRKMLLLLLFFCFVVGGFLSGFLMSNMDNSLVAHTPISENTSTATTSSDASAETNPDTATIDGDTSTGIEHKDSSPLQLQEMLFVPITVPSKKDDVEQIATFPNANQPSASSNQLNDASPTEKNAAPTSTEIAHNDENYVEVPLTGGEVKNPVWQFFSNLSSMTPEISSASNTDAKQTDYVKAWQQIVFTTMNTVFVGVVAILLINLAWKYSLCAEKGKKRM